MLKTFKKIYQTWKSSETLTDFSQVGCSVFWAARSDEMYKVQLKLLCLMSLWLTNQRCFTLIHSYKSDLCFCQDTVLKPVYLPVSDSQMLAALNLFIFECFKSSWVRSSLPCIFELHYQTSKCRRLFCNCGEKSWAFTSPTFFILKSACRCICKYCWRLSLPWPFLGRCAYSGLNCLLINFLSFLLLVAS